MNLILRQLLIFLEPIIVAPVNFIKKAHPLQDYKLQQYLRPSWYLLVPFLLDAILPKMMILQHIRELNNY